VKMQREMEKMRSLKRNAPTVSVDFRNAQKVADREIYSSPFSLGEIKGNLVINYEAGTVYYVSRVGTAEDYALFVHNLDGDMYMAFWVRKGQKTKSYYLRYKEDNPYNMRLEPGLRTPPGSTAWEVELPEIIEVFPDHNEFHWGENDKDPFDHGFPCCGGDGGSNGGGTNPNNNNNNSNNGQNLFSALFSALANFFQNLFGGNKPITVPNPIIVDIGEFMPFIPDKPDPYDDNRPCNKDPKTKPTIAPSGVSGVNGGRFGMTRKDGNNNPKNHGGLDVYAEENTPIYAMYSGKVVFAGFRPDKYDGMGSFGINVRIETLINGQLVQIIYAHLSQADVQVGQTIEQGAQIGLAGKTGNANGKDIVPHVHVEVRKDGEKINPEPFLHTLFDKDGKPTNHNDKCNKKPL
jgi:murein DD-endopeptidase MepM/ murein hydrolase activator NlpD